MSKADPVLCSGLDEEQATRVVALLLAMGFEPDAESTYGSGSDIRITVAADRIDDARKLLMEEYPYGVDRAADARYEPRDPLADPVVSAPPHWFGRGTGAILAVLFACATVFVASLTGPDPGSRSRLLELGAISWSAVERGEHWRLLTAVFVHFDLAHLLSNMLTLLLVGPPLAHLLGGSRFLLVFAASGFGANVVSHAITPTLGLKAGASGAIAGVLGALGGQALRPGRKTRFRSWQIVGALAAFYGLLIGFGPGRDNTAHLAGIAFGVVLGWLIDPLPDASVPAALREPPDPPR